MKARLLTRVGAGDDLEEMPVGVLEIHPAATVVVVDLALPLSPGSAQ